VVWCGVVWCGVVWCGVARCGVAAWLVVLTKRMHTRCLSRTLGTRKGTHTGGVLGIHGQHGASPYTTTPLALRQKELLQDLLTPRTCRRAQPPCA